MQRILNVGCGKKPLYGAVNLDCVALPGVDVVHNLENIPYPFPDYEFDCVVAEDVLEHVVNFVGVVQELGRVLKIGGVLNTRGPDCNFPEQVWADPTHLRAFAPRTFDNFDPETWDGRMYGHYFGEIKFKVIKVEKINKGINFTLLRR